MRLSFMAPPSTGMLGTMKIATWNVNSVKARWDRLLSWLDRHATDVLCLHERKLETDSYPRERLPELGYHAVIFGQKTYNGVAILSRAEASDVRLGFDDGVADDHARLASARIGEITFLSIYVPN